MFVYVNPVALLEEKHPEIKEAREYVCQKGMVKSAIAWYVALPIILGVGTLGGLGAYLWASSGSPGEDAVAVRKRLMREYGQLPEYIIPAAGIVGGAGIAGILTKEKKNLLRNMIIGGLLGGVSSYFLQNYELSAGQRPQQ